MPTPGKFIAQRNTLQSGPHTKMLLAIVTFETLYVALCSVISLKPIEPGTKKKLIHEILIHTSYEENIQNVNTLEKLIDVPSWILNHLKYSSLMGMSKNL